MNINVLVRGLVLFGLLASSLCGYAQTSHLEESSNKMFQTTQPNVHSPSKDSTIVSNQLRTKCYNFNAKQLIIPGVFITAGVFGVYNGKFKNLNSHIKKGMDNLRGKHYFHADDYIQYLPALTYLTFGMIGIKSKHSFKERVVVEATSYIVMAALTNIGKYSFKEKRPDSNARNSFPSGHTATVFTGAELMREEYGLGIGIGAYTVATGIAFLRLYNGRHWLNDVLAGAGLGILSARIGYWMLPIYQRWFKWENKCADIMVITPTYNYSNHSFSLNLAYTF